MFTQILWRIGREASFTGVVAYTSPERAREDAIMSRVLHPSLAPDFVAEMELRLVPALGVGALVVLLLG
jgi:hypothetical protein